MNENTSPHLLLVLDGPMQAWGYLSLFDRRNCLHYPTRSALLGMFCAAAGIDRADQAGLRRWDPLRLEVHAYRKLRARLRLDPTTEKRTVGRPLRYRRWWDYHTVGGGYDEKTHRFFIPFSAEGKPRGTVVTHREYLADACFVVLVAAPSEPSLLTELCVHLCQPRWGIWFGRKCCLPAFPVCHKVHPSRQEALAHLRQLAKWRPLDLDQPLRIVREVDRFEDGTDTLLDVPVDFQLRKFAPRRVCEEIPPPNQPPSAEAP
ncbi:MAG: type I-E CRISPR-associated protein Cas5/CasD [Thermoguttaceae bacterium]|nr:type I-E CRISPR-associated protein Cas5/CasD [Thermoguttaceae bacterium]MDW8079853.1 type I-E CRISPR-associated protein Cas5/CasD [Thermoguttaceae bacterium]